MQWLWRQDTPKVYCARFLGGNRVFLLKASGWQSTGCSSTARAPCGSWVSGPQELSPQLAVLSAGTSTTAMSRNHSCGASKLPRIIVTFAVGAEFAPWRRKRKFLLVRSSEVPKYSGEYDNAEVCVLITGIGMRHAHAELPKILAEPADACVVCGLAGSLRAQHQ